MNSKETVVSLLLLVISGMASCVNADQALLLDRDLSDQAEKVNVANAWNITDEGLKRLRSYIFRGEVDFYVQNKVRSLSLDGTLITDEGMKHLIGKDGLVLLEELSLADTRITNEGLAYLADLGKLRRLKLGLTCLLEGDQFATGIRINRQDIEDLRKAMPDCLVEHEFIVLELTVEQRELFDLWSQVAIIRLNAQGNIDRLMIYTEAQLTQAHEESLRRLKHLTELHAGSNLNAEQIALLSGQPQLRKICLRDCRLDDDAIAKLNQIASLEVLDLGNTQITDRGLGHLEILKEITALDLRGTEVRTKGLQSLKQAIPEAEFLVDAQRVVQLPYSVSLNDRFELKGVGNIGFRKNRETLLKELTELLNHPSLEQLGLRHCAALVNEDLATLAKMSNLKELDLGNTKITNEGIHYLGKLKNLEKLNLWHTKITGDGGLAALADLPKLWSLELDETRIDDRCLPIVDQMGPLSYLELWHTDVTRAGVVQLQRVRPEVEIKSNPRQ